MRKVRFILVLTLFLSAALACRKEQGPEDGIAGECSAVFRLSSRDAISLQTKTDADDLLDGLRFTNVLVILVDHSNNVVGNVYKEYPYNPAADDVIHFEHLNPGNYTAYAYANIDAEAWQKSGEVISGQEKVTTSGDFSSFLERELKAANPVTPTVAGETTMLLTGQAEVLVGLSVETHTVYLKRPVVRLRVYINNTTPYPVRLDDLQFSEFNADRAYLIGRSDDSGVPSVPAGVTYGPLPSYPILSASPETAPQSGAPGYEEEYLVYETLLYENACPDPYKVFALLTLDPADKNLQMSLGEMVFEPVSASTLNGMENGKQMDVLLIYPRKQTRSARLYYGVSAEDNYAWESCGYEVYSNLLNRVRDIFTESPSHSYFGYSYNGLAGTNSGLAGWTGLEADAPLGPAPNGPTVTFNYTGANSGTPKKYVRTLTRGADGKFSFEGLSTSTTILTNMRIQQGSKIDGEKRFAKDLPGDCMINFIQDDSGLYLRSDCFYNSSDLDVTKKSRLVWQSYVNDKHDFQFMLFRQKRDGAPLKRILKESHKEVPLTYMTRNEDIKLVINVFYADQEGTLNFDVDNSTWTTPSESSHTFN